MAKAAADKTAGKQREIQREQDSNDRAQAKAKPDADAKKPPKPVQTGGRERPGTPLPGQKLDKPGIEAEMELRPQFEAPDYEGSHKLRGMTAIITGGDSGIGRAVAVLFAREGADVAIVYLNEHEDAEETKDWVEKEGQRCLLIPGDVKDPAFCKAAVDQTVRHFGSLEVLVNNAAFQEHAADIGDITDERFDETL
ncbi:MAG: SDR family NAD(P)-dependent oxidoreductase, partial [Burkholderiaceae bacterium]